MRLHQDRLLYFSFFMFVPIHHRVIRPDAVHVNA